MVEEMVSFGEAHVWQDVGPLASIAYSGRGSMMEQHSGIDVVGGES